jgi:hypothetical protein
MRSGKTAAIPVGGCAFCVDDFQGGDFMQMKDATRRIGSVGIFIPLILIFLTAANSAFACPGHNGKVAYRTSRAVSYTPTTVIAYKAPASYRRCGDNMFDTRGKRYVAVRSNGYYNGSGAKYVAVRNGGYYTMPRTRYVAVRNVDNDYAPRYVAVRPRYPVYRINDSRYAEIRSGYRTGNGIVRYIDFDDEPRHVANRHYPAVRYVAVERNDGVEDLGRTKYVAFRKVNSGCTRAIAHRSCLDQVETASVRRAVLRNDDVYSVRSKQVVLDDDAYSARTKQVVLDDDNNDYVAVANDTPKYVEYMDPIHTGEDRETYVAASEMENYPRAVSTRTIIYEPVSYDDDMDHQAYLEGGSASYVAESEESEDACMPRTVVYTNPEMLRSKAVSYVAIEPDDDEAYIETDEAAPLIRYVASDEDRVFDDVDPTYVAADDVDDVNCFGGDTVAYVPVETVSYVPVEKVRYASVDDVDVETTSNAPVAKMHYSDARSVSDEECPAMVSSVNTEPVYVAGESAALVEEVYDDVPAGPSSTQIASHYGYRDGFEDGLEAALERDIYHPENSGDYEKATEGYESDFGDKYVYKENYRDSYLRGYRAGFVSVSGSA